MPYPIRTIFAISLLSSTLTAPASTPLTNALKGHLSIGIQAAAAMTNINNSSYYLAVAEGGGFQSFEATNFGTAGLFGAHIGYDWKKHSNDFGLDFSVNEGVKEIRTISQV